MSFHNALERLTLAAAGQRGAGPNCTIQRNDLHELLAQFIRLDNDARQSQSTREAMSPAAAAILAERRRQVVVECWDAKHDDQEHRGGGLARAAATYALAGSSDGRVIGDELTPSLIDRLWPWGRGWWKPKTRRSNLVRAGALILAEIERLDRASAAASPGTSTDNLVRPDGC